MKAKDDKTITTLYHILMIPDYDTIVYESTARILSIILSELDPKRFGKEQENFLGMLLNVLT
jgi:hypothetical protein